LSFCVSSLFKQPVLPNFTVNAAKTHLSIKNILPTKKNGVFVDIGANDGIFLSNTYFFEKKRGWRGICIEPIPETFATLRQNRNCICVQGCIGPENQKGIPFLRISGPLEGLSGIIERYDPKHVQRIEKQLKEYGGSSEIIEVDCYNLNDLLTHHHMTHIDFLSIDTEGGELEILKSIDFEKFQIDVITVENNYKDPEFQPFMLSKGYRFVTSLEQDLIFVRKRFKK